MLDLLFQRRLNLILSLCAWYEPMKNLSRVTCHMMLILQAFHSVKSIERCLKEIRSMLQE